MLEIGRIEGNNNDFSPSMYWEGSFKDGREFELSLKYGTVILTINGNEYVLGYTSDFPNVADVESVFKHWVNTNPPEINN
jgi:hypothetical protein